MKISLRNELRNIFPAWLGCVVVVLVYGWHASSHDPPYTDMPWTHPNLLVWLFWLNTGVLSLWLYLLGKRRYMQNMALPPNIAGADAVDAVAGRN